MQNGGGCQYNLSVTPHEQIAPPTTSQPIFQRLDLTAHAPYPRNYYPRRLLWKLISKTIFRLPRAWRWRAFLLRSVGAKVGENVIVHTTVKIMHPWLLEISDNSTLAPGVEIYNPGNVSIGSHTVLSQGGVYLRGHA
jgi:acetyltransferase-like isoleucine patch superfamily enzyme